MKIKNLLLTIALTLATLTAHAGVSGSVPYAAGDPTMIVKLGGFPMNGNEETTTALTVEYQTRHCLNYTLCYNPYVIMLDHHDGDKSAGVGLDFKYSLFKRVQDRFYLSAGVVAFDKASNEVNRHVGVGIEIENVSLSFDVYTATGFSDESPAKMVTLGLRF